MNSASIINRSIESVMDLIDAMGLFSTISRGALGTGEGLCCEVAPSSPDEIYMSKNQYLILDLTINGKHTNLQVLSDTMNMIHEGLTFIKSYPSASDWKIIDITTLTEPQVIAREENNAWMMASSLAIKVQTKKGEN